MTFGELKELAEKVGIDDDFEIDIVGEHSGSFGKPQRVGRRVVPFPTKFGGDYKEFQLFINA